MILFVAFITIGGCKNQQLCNHVNIPRLLFRLDDLGSSAPDSPPSGPILGVWSDGLVAISTSFPNHSSSFRMTRIASKTAGASFEDLMQDLPLNFTFALGESKARATFYPGESVSGSIERDLPMCYLNLSCAGRLGATAFTNWKNIKREIDHSITAVPDASEMGRVRAVWQ